MMSVTRKTSPDKLNKPVFSLFRSVTVQVSSGSRSNPMDYDFVPFCAPVHTKKRKLSDEVNDNVNAQTVEEVRGESLQCLAVQRARRLK